MFNEISRSYDFTNRVMTFGLDSMWRKKLTSLLPEGSSLRVLDCATGTGDQILSLLKHNHNISQIVGIDLAKEMLSIAQQKLNSRAEVDLRVASALDIPYPNDSFDVVTISFGIRNVTDVKKALSEFNRVLKPGGRLLILEGTVPRNPFLKFAHLTYLRHVLPRLGGWISKNKDAYKYLNQTIESFPSGQDFCDLVTGAGFTNSFAKTLTGGTVTIYIGDKVG